jgi:hypothetical protein
MSDKPEKQMEDRVEMFERDGIRFIFYDVSHFRSNAEFSEFIALAENFISKFPQEAAFCSVTNIEGVTYDSETKKIVAEWMNFNRPFIKYGAVIGLDGIKKIMVNSILRISGRSNMKFFHSRQEAIDWFLSQKNL